MPYDRLINTILRFSNKGGDGGFYPTLRSTVPTEELEGPSISSAFQSVKNMASYMLANPDRSSTWRYSALPATCRAVRKYQPDVILATSPPHSTQLLASWTKRLTGVPLICDFRDPWNRTPLLNRLRGQFRRRSEERMEQFCIRTADRIILNTPQLEEEFRDYYSGSIGDKLHVIPNGFDPEVSTVIQQLPSKKSGLSARLVACHPGTLYAGRDIRPRGSSRGQAQDRGHSTRFPSDRTRSQCGLVTVCTRTERRRSGPVGLPSCRCGRRMPRWPNPISCWPYNSTLRFRCQERCTRC